MSTTEDITAQLADELGGVARDVAVILGADVVLLVEQRIDDACGRLTAQLCSDDDHESAAAARDVMAARWPADTEPPPEWWRTPAGRAVARSGERDDSEAVTRTVAAAMLGVSPGSIAQMVHRARHGLGGSGGLEPHPDGGITRASVLARLARP